MRYKILTLFLVFIFTGKLSAQSGLKFNELAMRLDPYFAKELILDIKKQLPQGSDYNIWGFDVGDYSGDGYFDCAVSLKLAAEKKKIIHVYFFVDIEGYLTEVGNFQYEFFEIPLEIGVVIKDNACFVTRKREQFNWLMDGFRFINGTLVKLDRFTTKKDGLLTHETYRNYLSLENTERYIYTRDGEEKFYTKFLAIPCYERGRQIYQGFPENAVADNIDFVHKGAYFWDGPEDASYKVRSAWDNRFIYFTLDITDDNIVTQRCDTCLGDHVDIWFDVLPPYLESGDRFAIHKGGNVKFRISSEIGLYRVSVYPGNFLDKEAYTVIGTTDNLEEYQKTAAKTINAVSSIKDDDSGMIIKFRVPHRLLGFEEIPFVENAITELGCSVVYHDIDNEYRPEEETLIATSQFSSLNPSSYGSLLLIPSNRWYGETHNIYKEDIIKYLIEYGY